MFNIVAYQVIDAVQDTKRQVVNAVVSNEELNTILHKFIDQQTEYTKNLVDAGLTAASGVLGVVTSGKFHKELTDKCWHRK